MVVVEVTIGHTPPRGMLGDGATLTPQAIWQIVTVTGYVIKIGVFRKINPTQVNGRRKNIFQAPPSPMLIHAGNPNEVSIPT